MIEKGLVIIGAGGLGAEYAWVAEDMNRTARFWNVLGYVDDSAAKTSIAGDGRRLLGEIEAAAANLGGSIYFAVAVGNNAAREKLVHRAETVGWQPATLVHPSVIVAGSAIVGDGSYLAPGSIICPGARVERHVIVNVHASVGHDSIVGDYAQICPGARISGGCRIGKHAFLGSNAAVSPRLTVGEGASVGANSHAVRNVAAGLTVVGCPAAIVHHPGVRRQEKSTAAIPAPTGSILK